MNPIRNSARAIILSEQRLLTIAHADAEGAWYSLPGGGQHPGENLSDTLQRECLEELGVPVQVGALRYVRDYISANHEFSEEDPDVHHVELMFECTLLGDLATAQPTNPDDDQLGLAWLPLAELPSLRLYPSQLRTLLPQGPVQGSPVYLGDVN
jgi:8-oxo-dGTP pyrophosphatase MutT (NUDIX family)